MLQNLEQVEVVEHLGLQRATLVTLVDVFNDLGHMFSGDGVLPSSFVRNAFELVLD